MRSPINWIGGKGVLAGKLVKLVPPKYNAYVEPFFGGGSVFFRLPPAPLETVNDLDRAVVDFFKVLRDAGSFKKFYRLAEHTPWSRTLYNECKAAWEHEENPVVRAWQWWVLARQSFGGKFAGSWGFAVKGGKTATSFISVVKNLPAVHKRLQSTQIECQPAFNIIKAYAAEGCFIYCDPPYTPEERVTQDVYVGEMSTHMHGLLVDILLRVPAFVMLSGYPNPVYAELERRGWRTETFETFCFTAGTTTYDKKSGIRKRAGNKEGRRSARTERVWMNYTEDGKIIVSP